MNWTDAVDAMKRGAWVQRKSEQYRRLIDNGEDDGLPVYECGQEAMRLVTAFSEDGQFVRVFQGAGSKVLFEPDDEHMNATDWVETEES